MRVNRINYFLMCCLVVSRLDAMPPEIVPYQIPSFDGRLHDFKAPVAALLPAPTIDGDAIFEMVVHCFPEEIAWQIEFKAVSGVRASENHTISSIDTSGLSRYYAGVVAEMPFYSASEINRERQESYTRRTHVAATIEALLIGIAQRRIAQRQLGLYSSLEARSQARVASGIVDVSEQVHYLEQVATAQASLDIANAKIQGARLNLVGQCRDEVAPQVNRYLLEIAQ